MLLWIKVPLTFDVIIFRDPYSLMPQQLAVGPHNNMVKTKDYKCNIMNVSMQHKKAEKENIIQILRLNDNHDNQEYSIKVNCFQQTTT